MSCVKKKIYAKTKEQNFTAKLISAFVFATRIVQFLFYLYPKFPASSHLLCLYRSVCVRLVWKPHTYSWFSHDAAQMLDTETRNKPRLDMEERHCSGRLHQSFVTTYPPSPPPPRGIVGTLTFGPANSL